MEEYTEQQSKRKETEYLQYYYTDISRLGICKRCNYRQCNNTEYIVYKSRTEYCVTRSCVELSEFLERFDSDTYRCCGKDNTYENILQEC